MGADLWHEEITGFADPSEALLAIQARLAGEYDFASILPERRASAQEAIRATVAEGDPYALLDFYRAELATIERAMSSPIPDDPRSRIELIRELESSSGQGFGNILDVREVADHRDVDVAERLDDEAMIRLLGTTRPTSDRARAAIGAINEELGRGECVCYPYFAERSESPAGWFFVGNTHD